MKGLNVISLFDGLSCGQIALNKAGFKIDKYYASEIDKYGQIVSKANFPNTIYIGDVRNVKATDLGHIDLLIGGSPCQSFSFAGKRKGMATKCELQILSLSHYLELKEQNFEFEGQSYLFWEYMRVLEEIRLINPDVKFLLENVLMGSYWQKVLSVAIGINPIMINSSLVSAQNRKRLYFTNIGAESDGLFGDLKCMIPQPKDKGILLKDILEVEVDEKYYLTSKATDRAINNDRSRLINNLEIKSGSILANQSKQSSDMITICVASRGRNPENPKSREPGLNTEQQLEARNDGKTNCLTSVQKDNLVMQLNPSKESGGKQPYQQNRVYDANGISPALCAFKSDLLIVHNMMPRSSKSGKGGTGHLTRQDGKTYCLDTGNTNAVEKSHKIRRLTPLECERLQTIPDFFTAHVSDSQRYKMLGNGWTVDVVAYIFSYYKP